jgi:hypothetical protein
LKESTKHLANKEFKELELSKQAPAYAHKLSSEAKMALAMLFSKFIYRTIPSKPGSRGVTEVVSISTTDLIISELIECLSVKPKVLNVQHSSKHYPFTGSEYEQIEWNFNEEEVQELFSMFEHIKPALETLYIQDAIQRGKLIRIDYPYKVAPFIFARDPTKFQEYCDENGFTHPIFKHIMVRIGKFAKRSKVCFFKMIYTRDLNDFLPAGTLKFSYGYDLFSSGLMQDAAVEGTDLSCARDDIELDCTQQSSTESTQRKKPESEAEAFAKFWSQFEGFYPKKKKK